MPRTTCRGIAVAAFVATITTIPIVACIIADPPAEIPVAPLARPVIRHEEVVPPISILRTWPLEFVIPVDVPDPASPVLWRAFFDYDPIQRPGFIAHGELDPDPTSADAGVRVAAARIGLLGDPNACHTLEVIVALGFDEDHTPDSIGGDSVTWFYSPTGSIDGCPTFDAGPLDGSIDGDASDSSVFIEPPADGGDD